MNDEFFKLAIEELSKADRVIIGLSGGADSVCLTHLLSKHIDKNKLVAAHVNHGIRGEEASKDAEFSKSFAESLGIEFRLLEIDVKKLSKELSMGEEECGRKYRYEFFSSLLLSETSLIATAHNADDNAETLIMNLMRGCGSKGLCSIPFKRGNIIRPILSLTREEIEDYCKENDLKFVTDSTNLDDDYKRNKVRHRILSEIKKLCPEFTKNTFSATRLLSLDMNHLECEVEKLYSLIDKGTYLDVSTFSNLDISLQLNLVSHILKKHGAEDITSTHVKLVREAILNNLSVSVPRNKEVNVKQKKLTVISKLDTDILDLNLKIGDNLLPDGRILRISQKNLAKNEKIHNLLFNYSIDCDKINGCLKLTNRSDGDKITLRKRNVTKSLKKLFNEMKIPAALRNKILIVRDERNVVFAENVGINKIYEISENTKNYLTLEIIREK